MGDSKLPFDLSDERLDWVESVLGAPARQALEEIDAGTLEPVGDVEPLRRAVEEMDDRGTELRALPGNPEPRRALFDAILSVAVASIGALHGDDSERYRSVDEKALRALLDREEMLRRHDDEDQREAGS